MAGALLCGSLAQAQATRTWVSGVGDDANPCSRTAPCKTFAGSIAKTAPGGEINVLDPGGFGAVTITKSITISSEGFEAGVLVSGTNGIVIANTIASDTVIIRGLDIEGLGTGLIGINFLGAGKLYVEKCTIHGFRGGSATGISFTPTAGATGSQLHVTDTIIRDNGTGTTGGGIFVQQQTPTAAITINGSLDRVQMKDNVFGLKVAEGAAISVRDSLSSGNAYSGFTGLSTSGFPVRLAITDSTSSGNGTTGVQANGLGVEVRISNMTITGNQTGMAPLNSGNLITFKTNQVDGNSGNGSSTTTAVLQ
jgi:hypothetical protein